MANQDKAKGLQAFEQFFSEIYGERWPRLKSALTKKETQVARKNIFADSFPEFQMQGEIPRANNGLLAYYVMDPASQVPAHLLNVEDGDVVLDMCAAPGGKTLIMAEKLKSKGELIANEMSEARRERLTKVIQNYVSRDVRNLIHVKGKDGGKYALTHKEYFDKILIDAPCSGERHLLENQKELAEWTLSRTKKLAQRQYALLTAALLALKPGGTMVYSTCSISPLENDGVLETLLKKKDGFEIIEADLGAEIFKIVGVPEKTKYGCLYLPDQSGIGPIYFCVMRKF